jgi:Concanavalin A-like lectin/glucanases superfamily
MFAPRRPWPWRPKPLPSSGVSSTAMKLALGVVLLALVAQSPTIVWPVDSTTSLGGHAPRVLGAPRVIESAHGKAVSFDGIDDGLIVPANPLAGLDAFTIEVLFLPEAGGPAEQRFLHVEDEAGARALIETRLTTDGKWALDTFLMNGTNRLPLLDRTLLHPTGVWTWAALRYDGRTMSSHVNGKKELEGAITFPPMQKGGRTSLGVRLNEVYWFKGAIREVRFHPIALAAKEMRRIAPDAGAVSAPASQPPSAGFSRRWRDTEKARPRSR